MRKSTVWNATMNEELLMWWSNPVPSTLHLSHFLCSSQEIFSKTMKKRLMQYFKVLKSSMTLYPPCITQETKLLLCHLRLSFFRWGVVLVSQQQRLCHLQRSGSSSSVSSTLLPSVELQSFSSLDTLISQISPLFTPRCYTLKFSGTLASCAKEPT